jgi:hypothetical protein
MLAIGSDQVFLINKADCVVARLSALARRYGPLLVWPRSSLRGVVLVDGVKGNEAGSFSFAPAGVMIRHQADGNPQMVRVPFE